MSCLVVVVMWWLFLILQNSPWIDEQLLSSKAHGSRPSFGSNLVESVSILVFKTVLDYFVV